MKAIVNTGPHRLEWQEVATPQPAPGQVLIKTLACGICATDLEMIAGWERTGFPSIPGHEWSGCVEAVGFGVNPKLIGRACVAENVLSDGGEVGFEHSGGYGEYLVTEAANLHLLPESFPPHVAALIEPLAVCLHGVRRANLDHCGSVVVLGDGPIGLMMLMLLKSLGVTQVDLIGGCEVRLRIAAELGADSVSDYRSGPGPLTGDGYSAIVEASGSPTALTSALDSCPNGTKLLILGDYGSARADFEWNRILHRELEIIGSNASAGVWAEAVALAVDGKLSMQKLVSQRLPAEQFAEGLELARRRSDALKVVLEWH
jgi:2-desacetyl-2-hydroxyethyl bacteriochlorophyllide A dehydrogenase